MLLYYLLILMSALFRCLLTKVRLFLCESFQWSQCNRTEDLTALEWYNDICTSVSVYFVFYLYIKPQLVLFHFLVETFEYAVQNFSSDVL